MIELDAIALADVAHTCPTQTREISSAIQCPANVSGQRTDVSALATNDTDSHRFLLFVIAGEFHLIYMYSLWFQLHGLTVAAQLVGPRALNLTRTIGWRHLLDITLELFQRVKDEFPCDMLHGISSVDLMLTVIAGGGSTQLQRRRVFLGMALQRLDLLGAPACAENQNTCRQWVERTGMAYLHFLSKLL